MSLSGFQIDPIDIHFHLQKSLQIFDKNSVDKMWSKKDKGVKVPSLMPIRVNYGMYIGLSPGWSVQKLSVQFMLYFAIPKQPINQFCKAGNRC